MSYGYNGITFEAEPARPAPGQSREPSPIVIEKLGEMLPAIDEIRSVEATLPLATE